MGTRKNPLQRPQIEQISPAAAIAGGEIQIRGRGLAQSAQPQVRLGDAAARVLVGSDSYVVVRVPEGASGKELTVGDGGRQAACWPCQIGLQITDSLHPVGNPAVDRHGNVFATFSGARGQKTPAAVYKIGRDGAATPFVADMMNATGLAFDRDGILHVSSRYDGTVYRAAADGSLSIYVEGMGIATGIAFDPDGNLFVGDRSGTIFKISTDRQIYVFATLEPSMAAYHLAIGPDKYLYVSGPTTSSYEAVHRVSPAGDIEVFYRGLGRPQGLAFDAEGRLYVAASMGGRKGIVRIGQDRAAELFLSGPQIIGLAFTPSRSMIVATASALHRVDVGIQGKPLP
ncbi:MAG TPA: IPT/TIG domain-containing protein [Bryobacteraceae bacterium]|nr:IPT/TIG domain-containing protein [Bryobacteraceae bacterium]